MGGPVEEDNALLVRPSLSPARALAGMDAAKAGPPDGAATDRSAWRWWVNAILDAQRQVDRASAQVARDCRIDISFRKFEVWGNLKRLGSDPFTGESAVFTDCIRINAPASDFVTDLCA